MIALSLFIFFLAWTYVILILNIISAWSKQEEFKAHGQVYKKQNCNFTILIPARNEELNIGNCLSSILENNSFHDLQPGIIVVDDYSEDRTSEVVGNIEYNALRLLHMRESGIKKTKSSKKRALHFALEHVETEYVLQLDADTRLNREHLGTLNRFLTINKPDFVACPVVIESKGTLFEDFQCLDYLGMMAVTQAGIFNNYWFLANGANMAYRKSMVNFGSMDQASGDDVSAINSVASKQGNIHFLKSRSTVALTPAINKVSGFFQQRIRWGGKNRSSTDKLLIPMIILSYLVSLAFIFLPLIYFYYSSQIFIILLCNHIFCVFIADYIMLRELSDFFNCKSAMKNYIPSSLLHIMYIAILGSMSIFAPKYKWKGRIQR